MKKKRVFQLIFFGLLAEVIPVTFVIMMLPGCIKTCQCDYVQYDRDPTTNYQWEESYRSTWDYAESCDNYTLDESTYTDSDGDKWYSRTDIECN